MSYIYLERISCKCPDISIGHINCLVAASSLAAIFTLGERYDASILKNDPIAPSMAHP